MQADLEDEVLTEVEDLDEEVAEVADVVIMDAVVPSLAQLIEGLDKDVHSHVGREVVLNLDHDHNHRLDLALVNLADPTLATDPGLDHSLEL